MTVTHLVRHAVDPDFAYATLEPDMVYCGSASVQRHSECEDVVDGWCTVEYMFTDPEDFTEKYGHESLCPLCLEHPDVALMMLGEV